LTGHIQKIFCILPVTVQVGF